MKARAALVAVALAVGLAGCSNSLEDKPAGNGQCEQTQRQKFVGITYRTERTRFSCESIPN